MKTKRTMDPRKGQGHCRGEHSREAAGSRPAGGSEEAHLAQSERWHDLVAQRGSPGRRTVPHCAEGAVHRTPTYTYARTHRTTGVWSTGSFPTIIIVIVVVMCCCAGGVLLKAKAKSSGKGKSDETSEDSSAGTATTGTGRAPAPLPPDRPPKRPVRQLCARPPDAEQFYCNDAGWYHVVSHSGDNVCC